MYAIGIDRGGSYTRISIFDKNFSEISHTKFISGELSDFVSKTLEYLTSNNATNIPTVVSSKGAMTKKEIRDYITENLKNKINLKAVISDAEGAHRAAFGEGNGFLIIVGTGSVLIYKQNEKYMIEGGKNPPGGDPGSGKWIGLKYLNELKVNYENWNDQKIADYASEVINKVKNENDDVCKKILEDAFKELCCLIREVLKKYEGIKEVKIALIGGVTSNEFFVNELKNYANKNIENVDISFFTPDINIEKASGMYAIKLSNNDHA